jgi:hypothetical protein
MRRSRLFVVLWLVLLVAALSVPASVSGASPAKVTVRPTVGTFRAKVLYAIDRPAQRIKRQRCWLTSPASVKTPTPCDTTPERVSDPTRTWFKRTVTITKAGTWKFSVRFTLRNGASVTGTRAFTIKPGPAVRFRVDGLDTQWFACRTGSGCADDDIPRQIATVTARDRHGNIAKGYTGTVQFPTGGTGVTSAKLRAGRGLVAVNPATLEPNAATWCSPSPLGAYDVTFTVRDKAHPSIRGCQTMEYHFDIVIEGLPIFVSIDPPGCDGDCFEDPTGTVVVDTGEDPVRVKDVDAGGEVEIVGATTTGVIFLQPILITDTVVQGIEIPLGSREQCIGCTTDAPYQVELQVRGYPLANSYYMEVGGGSTFKTVGLVARDPVTGRFLGMDVDITMRAAENPLCYASFADAFSLTEEVPC